MAQQQLPIMSPLKGVVRAVGREQQTPDTCWDAISVLPYDRYGRRRLSQRGGLAKQFPNQMNASFVQGMIEAPNIVYPPNALTVPQLSFNNIGVVWPITTIGNTGPFSVPPQVSWGVDYTWTLAANISASLSATWTDGVGMGGQIAAGGTLTLTIDVGASPNFYFIQLGGGGEVYNDNITNASASVTGLVRYGTSFAGGTNIGSATAGAVTGGTNASSISTSGTITVVITLSNIVINGTPHSAPLAATQFPQVTSASTSSTSGPVTGGTLSGFNFDVSD